LIRAGVKAGLDVEGKAGLLADRGFEIGESGLGVGLGGLGLFQGDGLELVVLDELGALALVGGEDAGVGVGLEL
jgi:hypothetical protein